MGPYNYVVAQMRDEERARRMVRAITWAGDYVTRVEKLGDDLFAVIADGQCCEGTQDYFHGWRAGYCFAELIGVEKQK